MEEACTDAANTFFLLRLRSALEKEEKKVALTWGGVRERITAICC